ncbi:MAG: NFACT family protein [Candidatus Anstonellales archaeon]
MRQLCAVECSIIAKEIRAFEGKRVAKVLGKKGSYFIKFGSQGIAIRIPYTVSVAETPEEKECDNFAQRLRSILKGKKLSRVEQVSEDRIIRMDFGELSLFIELFGKGNIIFCKDGKIEFATTQREYKHRKIKKGEPYIEPPKRKEVDKTGRVIAELINTGLTREYALMLMEKEGIKEEDTVEGIGAKWEKLLKMAEGLKTATQFYAAGAEYGIGTNGERFSTLSEAIERAWKSEAGAGKQSDPEEERRKRIVEQIKARIAELEKKIRWMEENKEEIEKALLLFKQKKFEELKGIGWIIDFEKRRIKKVFED